MQEGTVITAMCSNPECNCDIEDDAIEEADCGHIMCDSCLLDAKQDGCQYCAANNDWGVQ